MIPDMSGNTSGSMSGRRQGVLGDKSCSMHLREHVLIVYNRLSQPVEVELTKTEWAILETLLRHPLGLVTYRQLGRMVWGEEFEFVNSQKHPVHWHIAHIRKIFQLVGGKNPIKTVRGLGYKWIGG
jgi:DNA-binding response OmpR family regulator